MTNKKFLLLEENPDNSVLIQNSIDNLCSGHCLHVARDTSEALAILMGGSRYGAEYHVPGKGRPDYLLINSSFLDDKGKEFLDVIKKYYSLKTIQIYVINYSGEKVDKTIIDRYGIAGFVTPSSFNTIFSEVPEFKPGVSTGGKTLFSLPVFAFNEKFNAIFSFFKSPVLFHAGNAVATKVTLGAASTILAVSLVSTVGVSSNEKADLNNKKTHVMHAKSQVVYPLFANPPITEEIIEPVCVDQTNDGVQPIMEIVLKEKEKQVKKVAAEITAEPEVSATVSVEKAVEEIRPIIEARDFKIRVLADADSTSAGF